MLVGVCCECQQGGKSLRFERGRAIIDSHDAFGSFCQGSGTVPRATYDNGSRERPVPNGPNHFPVGPECDGETCAECNAGPIFSLEDHAASCSKSTFKSDRERADPPAVSISIGSLNGVMIGRAENVSISVGDLAKKWGAKKRG